MAANKFSNRIPARRNTRRAFLRDGAWGLTVATTGLALGAEAQSADNNPGPEEYAEACKEFRPVVPPQNWKATPGSFDRPFYREDAPFRAKISPPGATGEILIIHGRVWGLDTKKPLPHCVLEVWQADAQGRYDFREPRKPIHPDAFLNRARLITDETGYYEFETVHPGPRGPAASASRASRIHCIVRHPSYLSLTTQLFFKGDQHQAGDAAVNPALILDLKEHKAGAVVFKSGRFDIILERG